MVRGQLTRVALIPGAAGSSAFWDPVVQRMGGDLDVRPFDLPGLGNTPARADVASYDDLVDYVAADIPGSAVIVAQSMGVYVALQLALRYPHLVTGLVLIAATGGVEALQLGGQDWRSDYASTYPLAQSWARAMVRDFADDELREIRVPALLLWATSDALSPLRVAHRLLDRLPRARLLTFDSDDHWIVHRFAAPIADAIVQWAHRCGSRQTGL